MQLRFHLAGINNQNFLMRDEQTGTFGNRLPVLPFRDPLPDAASGWYQQTNSRLHSGNQSSRMARYSMTSLAVNRSTLQRIGM